MLTKGQLEEAQEECRTVTEGHIATLLTDTEVWKEYVAGWELTRKYAVSQAAIDVSGPSGKVCCPVPVISHMLRYSLPLHISNMSPHM